MATIKWLPEALDDIERLYAFLKGKNPEAADVAVIIRVWRSRENR